MQEGGLNPGRWEERLEDAGLVPTPSQPDMAMKVRLEDAGLVPTPRLEYAGLTPTPSQPDVAVKVLSEAQHELIGF